MGFILHFCVIGVLNAWVYTRSKIRHVTRVVRLNETIDRVVRVVAVGVKFSI